MVICKKLARVICKKPWLFVKKSWLFIKKPWLFIKNHGYLQKTMVICK